MQYLHTMLRVKDLDESLEFFRDKLGMKEVRRKESEKGRFTLVFLAAPEDLPKAAADSSPLVELTYNWPGEDGIPEECAGGGNFGHLAFRVRNIYETCQRLQEKGVVINRPPRDGYMAFIKSPDGISIELLQAGDPLQPKSPWAEMKNTGVW